MIAAGALVLGILSIMFSVVNFVYGGGVILAAMGLVCGIIAVIIGRANRGETAVMGRVCGVIGLIIGAGCLAMAGVDFITDNGPLVLY